MMREQTTLSPSAGIVAALRERTAEAHDRLEQSDFIMPSTRDGIRYARLIGAMLSFHVAIERQFQQFEEQFARRGMPMYHRYKAHLLRKESVLLQSPAVPEPALSFASVSHAAGGVYVMEGSTLGGTVIAKSIERHLQLTSSYYGCYGAATSERWRATRAQLEAFPVDGDERMNMHHGAAATFAALHAHLESFARSG